MYYPALLGLSPLAQQQCAGLDVEILCGLVSGLALGTERLTRHLTQGRIHIFQREWLAVHPR